MTVGPYQVPAIPGTSLPAEQAILLLVHGLPYVGRPTGRSKRPESVTGGRSLAMDQPTANLASTRYEFAFDTLRTLVPSLPSKTVFDIGSGDGQMRRIESLGLSWHGFDLAPSPGSSHWDLNQPCPDPSLAGAAIMLDVIEHCVNPGLALKNVAAALQPQARLIVTAPNPRWSRSRTHALFRGYALCFTQSDLDLNHHVFTTWPHILQKMLNDAGFAVDGYVTLDGVTRFWDRPMSATYPIRCLNSLSHILIERLDPSACGMSYGLVASKTAPAAKGQ